MSFEDGLRVVRQRGKFMQEACDTTRGGIAAVIGLDEAPTREVCAEAGVVLAHLQLPRPACHFRRGGENFKGVRTRQGQRRKARHSAAGGRRVSLAVDGRRAAEVAGRTGENKNFSTGGAGDFQVISPDTNMDINLSWKVNSKNETDEDNLQELSGDKCLQQYGTPVVIENSKHASISVKKDSKHSRLIFIPIPIERLETGKYQIAIAIKQGTLKSIKNSFFDVIWPSKPHSLSNFKIAVDALRHIATEAELDNMTAFSSSKSEAAFRAFWRKQNHDTTRAFNPAMAEYYRRVDETIKRFSSQNEADGYRTDRGRIYILFGSPSYTNRLLKPNSAPTEIWTYEKLKRRFIFTDEHKSGNYILTKMENY